MSENEDIDPFFEQGYNLIYKWLSDEERTDFDDEINAEEDHYEIYKTWEERFYRILNYIQIKYVNIEKYLNKIDMNLSKIFSYENVKLNDIVFIDYNEETYYLSNIKQIVFEIKPMESFYSLLKTLELEENYEFFMNTEKKGSGRIGA